MDCKVASNINFSARFDAEAYRRLMGYVGNSHGLKMGVESRLSHINEWGDKDSVVLLSKDSVNSAERFVLKNDKFSDKEAIISKPISDGKNSIFIAFFEITKKAILEAEKTLIRG